jgi:hypothetical protein
VFIAVVTQGVSILAKGLGVAKLARQYSGRLRESLNDLVEMYSDCSRQDKSLLRIDVPQSLQHGLLESSTNIDTNGGCHHPQLSNE